MSNRIAVVTPSFARDFKVCCELNESVTRLFPEARHYIFVDARDLALFRRLESPRTVVAMVEDVLPRGYFKLPRSKRWWAALPAGVPAKGWLIQQLVKLSVPDHIGEDVIVNVDSDVRFVRPVSSSLFVRDGRVRLYRLPGGIRPGMQHMRWHGIVCGLLGVDPATVPLDDYVGNIISWRRSLVGALRERIESVTSQPWHVAFARGRHVSEYLSYGIFASHVLGLENAGVYIDERPWCHTYWGPGPLDEREADRFVDALPDDDVAFSIAGYTDTPEPVAQRAIGRVIERLSTSALSYQGQST